MKHLVTLVMVLIASVACVSEPPLPISSGQYIFQHKFAEQPNMQSFTLTAKITGKHIVLINGDQSNAFPTGVLVDGTLMWHSSSKQWIVGYSKADKYVADVGGCSDGPEVVDLQQHIYWTC